VSGVAYTWDDNGNLLSDGVKTYTYDHANRLVSVAGPSSSVSYAYNGLGDRLQGTLDGVTTNYSLDLNNWLTQVLVDGTNTYLYGTGRIAQYDVNAAEYFLADGLGSVRQMVDSTGVMEMSKIYEPFGEVLNDAGTIATSYGFTGEWTDGTGLVYLRARYYSPRFGRFLSKDVWPGDYTRPLSLNGWNYVEGNSINYTDPSGMCLDEDMDGRCDPGWLCYSIPDPIAREKCFESYCSEYVLPWRRDPNYDSKTDSIPNWGDLSNDQLWRIERASKVWKWICETGGPWGSSCPQDQHLATWLLQEEQGILQNENYYEWNRPISEIILGLVVQYLHAELVYFDRSEALARQTAFFNPNADSKFNLDDWDSLMSDLNNIAGQQLNRHWGDNFIKFGSKKLIWWEPEESWAAALKPDYSMYGDSGKTYVIQHYAIVYR
jgi:RHS repeat-associated protein